MIEEKIIHIEGEWEEKNYYMMLFCDDPTPPDMSDRARTLRVMQDTYDRVGVLPAMRTLARAFRTPFNRVQKVYMALQAEGLIVLFEPPNPDKEVHNRSFWKILDYDGLFNTGT